MKRFVTASLIAALAVSTIPASASASGRFYRQIDFYSTIYGSPAGEPHGTAQNRFQVGWIRYYCDGSVRQVGDETGDYEDNTFGTCD